MILSLALFVVACEEKINPEIKINIEGNEVVLPAAAGEQYFTIESNVDWAINFKSIVDWCTISPTSGTAGSAAVKVTVLENTAFEARSATIVIAAGSAIQELTITQLQKDAFELLTEGEEVGPEGGTVNVKVMTNVPWTISLAENYGWLRVDAATKAYGEEAKTITVDPFDELDGERTAEVKVSAEGFEQLIFTVVQTGPESVIWYKNVTAIDGYQGGSKIKLAKLGDYLLVMSGQKGFFLNPLTGEKLQEQDAPVPVDNVCIDDGGNLIVGFDSDNPTTNGHVEVYTIPDMSNPDPVQLIKWNKGNYYGADAGNVRVRGNVKTNAVITVTVSAGANGAMIYWSIVNGEISNWSWTNIPYDAWSIKYSCAAPAGPKLSDGFFYYGYGKDGGRDFYYLADAKVNQASEWTKSFVTNTSPNENQNCIATATYKGKKYAAIFRSAHFNYSVPEVILLDVSNPSSATQVFSFTCSNFVHRDDAGKHLDWTDHGTHSDVLLVPTDDALLIYYVDGNFNVIGCSRYVE